jgi:thiol-disulfide isomerase/thioredoxin
MKQLNTPQETQMSLSRILSFSLLALAVGCATADQVKQLEERVASLEVQAATNAPAGGKKAAKADDKAEKAAAKLFDGVNKAIAANDVPAAKKKLAELKAKYASTAAYKRARRYEAELAVVGKDAPASLDIDKWLANKANIDLQSDNPTLLVFWEEWCPHCKREVPKMQKLHDTYKGQGLQMVGLTKITRSSTDDKVNAFIKDQKLSYPMAKEVVNDGKGNLSTHFSVRGVPAAAVVKGGKIVWRGHPGRLNEDMIKSWL